MTPAQSFPTIPIFCTAGNKVAVDTTTLAIGFQPQQQLPCEYYNQIENQETTALNMIVSGMNNITAELDYVVTQGGGTPAIAQTTQVKTALDNLYMAKLPIGTILMFDANNNWTDNVTLVGWYACVLGNAGLGCPNLVDRFILGKVVAGAGALGGANTLTITSAMLPPHTHDLSSHTHTVALGSHSHGLDIPTGAGGSIGTLCLNQTAVSLTLSITGPHLAYGTVTNTDLGTPTSSGPSTNTSGNGGFANSLIDTHPSYYSVVYIRRVS